MNSEFEKRLQRQPVKTLPPEWRQEILSAANAAAMKRCEACEHNARIFWPDWLVSLLWPHPKAWAGLAAVWVVILGLQCASRDESSSCVTAKAAPPSPELIAELKKQQRMFAELVGPREETVADRPKANPSRPRTRLEEFRVV